MKLADYEISDNLTNKLKNEVPVVNLDKIITKERLLSILNLAGGYLYQQGLKNKKFIDLMQRRYGINEFYLRKFQIGYASGKGLYSFLKKHGFYDFELMQTGLFYRPGVEFFKDRIMFPYISSSNICYFVGRSMNSKEKRKYIKQPTYDGSIGYISHPDITGQYIFGEDDFFLSENYILVAEGVTDSIMAKIHGIPSISAVTKYFSHKQLPRLVDLAKRKKIYIVGDTEISGGGQKGALQTCQKLANLGLEVYLLTIPLIDVTGDNNSLDEAFKRPSGKIDFNEWGRYHGSKAFEILLPTAIKIDAQILEPKITQPSTKKYIQDGGNKSIKSTSDHGDFNLIFQGCPALKRLWEQDHIPYEERRLILAFAVNTVNGCYELMKRWPSSVTSSHIANAQSSQLCPYTCKKLQEHGICKVGKDPILGSQCLPKRRSKNGEYLEASPIRFAFGIKRAFGIF